MWQHQELQNDGALGRDNGAGGQSLQPLTSQTLSLSPSTPRRGLPTAAALKEMQCCCCSSSSSSCWYFQVYIRRGGAEKLHFLHRVVHFCESSLTDRCLRQPVQTTAKARRMWKGGGLTLCARHHIWTLVTAGPYQGIHDQVYLDMGPRQCGIWYLILMWWELTLVCSCCWTCVPVRNVPSMERLQTVQPVQILVILHLDKIQSGPTSTPYSSNTAPSRWMGCSYSVFLCCAHHRRARLGEIRLRPLTTFESGTSTLLC